MTERLILPADRVSPSAQDSISKLHKDIVTNVQTTIENERVVVVGMKHNPVVKQACRLLQSHHVEYRYLEYGSYFSMWKTRLAIKLWTGWPTFPQIFVNGVLIGGYSDLKDEISSRKFELRLMSK